MSNVSVPAVEDETLGLYRESLTVAVCGNTDCEFPVELQVGKPAAIFVELS